MAEVEYKEVRVPLDVRGRSGAGPGITVDMARLRAARGAAEAAAPTIARALEEEGASGWEPDGPTDLPGLLVAGRASCRLTGGLLLSWRFAFDSVTVGFKRTIPPSAITAACPRCGAFQAVSSAFCSACGMSLLATPAGQGGVPACSFCGKRPDEVGRLIPGQGASICGGCVRSFQETLGSHVGADGTTSSGRP